MAHAAEGTLNTAWFLSVLLFAAMTSVLVIPPLLVDIAADFGISVALAGQLGTATFAAWAVSVVFVGPLSDSVGRRPVALAGLLGLTLSVVGSAFAPNLATLLALRVLTGLGGAVLPANAVAAISDVISPTMRSQAVGALLAVNVLTSAISVPVRALLADWRGWRFALLMAGLLLAAALVTNLLWFPSIVRERGRNLVFFSRYWSLLSLRFFRVGVAVGLTQRIAFWGMINYFAAYLISIYYVSVGYVALPLAIAATAQVIGSYSAGLVAKRRDRAILIATTSVVGGTCGLLFFAVHLDLWVAVAVATVGTGLLSVAMPTLVAASTEFSGESKATGAGLMGLSNQAGAVFGAALSGLLLASAGFVGVGYLCLGVTIVSALMAGLFGWRSLALAG